MKKLLFFTLIIIMLSIQPCMAESVFYDTYGHWAENDIRWATDTLKFFKGYGDLTFRPNSNITRGEFITVLSRTAFKLNIMGEVYNSKMAYNDMSMNHWSYTYVISMYKYLNSIKSNYFTDIFPGNNFYPDRPITREESVALIAAFSKTSIFDNPISFTDLSSSYKYYNDVKRLCNSNIVLGYDDNTFRPLAKTTRAETTSLIKRVYYDIKANDGSKYLNRIEFMPIKGEDMFSFFGHYDFNTTNALDKKYIKAKNTLEYVAFGGYIFPEDSHLYDLNAIESLKSLHDGGYHNVAGVNFYLISYGNFTNEEKNKFSNEILANIIARDDFKDSELMQLFTLTNKYTVKENLFVDALKKWNSLTLDNNSKANILFYRYAYYIKSNNKDMLRSIVYDDLKKSSNVNLLLNINWNVVPNNPEIDFRNFSFGIYNYAIYKNMTLSEYLNNPIIVLNNNSKVVELPNLLLIKKDIKQSYGNLNAYENFYYKYSLNRLYVLNFINERQRAFVEAINDYEIIKTFNMYRSNKINIDDVFTGILKKTK